MTVRANDGPIVNRDGLLVNFLAALSISVTASLLVKYYWFGVGWDMQLHCDALAIASIGGNPYDPAEMLQISSSFFWLPYPPLSLALFEVFCHLPHPIGYLSLYILAVILLPIITNRPLTLFTYALYCSGFHAVLVVLVSGNIAVIELVAFALTLNTIRNGHYIFAGMAMALCAFWKIIPLMLIPVFLLYLPRVAALRFGGSFIGTIGSLHGLGWLYYPELSRHYGQFLRNNLLGSGAGAYFTHNPGIDGNPSIKEFISDLGHVIGWNSTIAYLAFIGTITAALLLLYFYNKSHKSLFIALALVILTFPRLRHYGFALLLPCLVNIFQDSHQKVKAFVLVLACVGPIGMWSIWWSVNDKHFELPYSVVELALIYYPLFFSLAVVCLGLFEMRRTSVKSLS